MTSFVHLRLHTEFSLIDGLLRVRPALERVAELGMPALAITDHHNFFGLVKAYKAAADLGVKLIAGADVHLVDPLDQKRHHELCLLVQNETGYRNLMLLLSRSYQQGQYLGRPRVHQDWIAEYAEGVIALSGGRRGDIGQALLNGREDDARAAIERWQHCFQDRFYLELQRTGRADEERYLHAAVDLASRYSCPVVATNDVRFLQADEFEAHEARVCIGDGRTLDDPRRVRAYSEQQYLRSAEEMAELFADIPEALENSVEIARRCSLSLSLGQPSLPEYPVPSGETIDQFLGRLSFEGLRRRFPHWDDSRLKPYCERLEFELETINQMGFPGYFLVVMDFIQWAKDQDIPVGPGRGSGAGSLVAYALGITDLDPIEYDLLFERFLNPERVSMPDFDVDFCMERRDEVIDYVAQTYGRQAVSQIITFGTMAAKAVVRDVARVQGKPYGLADRMSKLIPFEVGMTLSKALEQEEQLVALLEEDSSAQEIWDMAVQLEGVTRNAGKHAGGVVIAPGALTDFSPIYCDEDGSGVVTQFDKNDVEEAGLVKFDFLGLRTLTIIQWATQMIDARATAPLDIDAIPLDDPDVFRLMQAGDTTAVFQLESRGMKELIKNLRPDCFEDIIALVALFRPGPLQSGMVENFINRKHGREPLAYPDAQYQHEWLQPILEPTYGIILYQEQVMQIAQVLAGYTLGGADLLRRAMGKKKPEEMAKQRSVFEAGAAAKGIDPILAIKIFDLVEKFAGYGFNKSHSAAYALVSYQTAWLKTHYPSEFMAAVMSSEIDNTDKLLTFRDEAKRMGLVVQPPSIQSGEYAFSVDNAGHIRYGLGAIKGLGEGPIGNLLAAREEGPFSSLFDLCARTDPRKMNRRALEALIKSGALDELGVERWVMLAALDDAIKAAEQVASNTAAGMTDLFGDVMTASETSDDLYQEHRGARPWSLTELLNAEKESLGSFLSGHPMEAFETEVRKFAPRRIRELQANNQGVVAGLIMDIRTIKTQRGPMAVLTLDDGSGQLEATVYNDVFTEHRDLLQKDRIVLLEGRLQVDDFNGGLAMRAKTARSLEQARQAKVSQLRVRVASHRVDDHFNTLLASTLRTAVGGQCPVVMEYVQPKGSVAVRLGGAWQVHPSDALLDELRIAVGSDAVDWVYEA
ncbi:MAG: DNA polymerase III subunit alpha [Pseudomonadota bacterium]|nr:DNA polymerase III subunit alpha [Pseudomonadota bacterium]